MFSPPVQLRRGVIERLWWAPGIPPGSTHYNYLTVSFWFSHLSKDTVELEKVQRRATMIIKCPGWFLDEEQVITAALLSLEKR